MRRCSCGVKRDCALDAHSLCSHLRTQSDLCLVDGSCDHRRESELRFGPTPLVLPLLTLVCSRPSIQSIKSVHRPDLMRGVVKGLMNYLVGDWGGRKVLPPPGPSRQNSEVKSLKGVGDTKNVHDHVEKERVRL